MSSWFTRRSPATRSALTGIALTVCACALFAMLDSATKFSGQALPMLLVVWLRYLAQALVTAALVLPRHGWSILRTQHPRFQFSRSAFGMATTCIAFFCIQSMPLGNFTAIWSASPLLIVVASAWLFKERISGARLVLLLIGLACVILIVRPESTDQPLGWRSLLPMALLLCGTGYQLLGSRLARLDEPATTQLYTTWLPMLLTAPLLPWFWQSVDRWQLWGAVLVMGVCSGVGHLLLLQAYRVATPATISPFLYSQIPFAVLSGWLLYGHIPDHWAVLGMLAIAVGGALSAWLSMRERR